MGMATETSETSEEKRRTSSDVRRFSSLVSLVSPVVPISKIEWPVLPLRDRPRRLMIQSKE